jgi:hypothetical protein
MFPLAKVVRRSRSVDTTQSCLPLLDVEQLAGQFLQSVGPHLADFVAEVI